MLSTPPNYKVESVPTLVTFNLHRASSPRPPSSYQRWYIHHRVDFSVSSSSVSLDGPSLVIRLTSVFRPQCFVLLSQHHHTSTSSLRSGSPSSTSPPPLIANEKTRPSASAAQAGGQELAIPHRTTMSLDRPLARLPVVGIVLAIFARLELLVNS